MGVEGTSVDAGKTIRSLLWSSLGYIWWHGQSCVMNLNGDNTVCICIFKVKKSTRLNFIGDNRDGEI